MAQSIDPKVHTQSDNTTGDMAEQAARRAVLAATRHAKALEDRSQLLRALGLTDAAGRDQAAAEDLRQKVLA